VLVYILNGLVNSFDRAAASSGEVIEGRSKTSIVPPYAPSGDNFSFQDVQWLIVNLLVLRLDCI